MLHRIDDALCGPTGGARHRRGGRARRRVGALIDRAVRLGCTVQNRSDNDEPDMPAIPVGRVLGRRPKPRSDRPARLFGRFPARTLTSVVAGALVTFLAESPCPRADDLANLRADQRALAERLDALEQTAQVGTAKPLLPPNSASLAGSFPRSFLIPGTDTSIQIGGYVDLSAAYFFRGGGNTSSGVVPPVLGGPIASALPVPTLTGASNPAKARQNAWFRMEAIESRLSVETRTPTAWGLASTHVEFDFFGCVSGFYCNDLNTANNPDVARLRLAYGTLGDFIAGQTWVPGIDFPAGPETLDFGGDVGGVGNVRAPQVGYKTPVAWLGPGATVGIYVLQPYVQLATPGGSFTDETLSESSVLLPAGIASNITKTFTPDGALVLNWEQPWGHLLVHAAIQPMELNDGAFISRRYVGYAVGFSGDVKFGWLGWAKDRFGFQADAGDGGGHWIAGGGSVALTEIQPIATNYGRPGLYGNGGPTTASAAAAILATMVRAFGAEINYQHWWRPNLRSTVSLGVAHQDMPMQLLGRNAITAIYNKELETAHANLIWSPVTFIDTGFEYIYDHRVTVFNKRGDGHILDWDFKVKF